MRLLVMTFSSLERFDSFLCYPYVLVLYTFMEKSLIAILSMFLFLFYGRVCSTTRLLLILILSILPNMVARLVQKVIFILFRFLDVRLTARKLKKSISTQIFLLKSTMLLLLFHLPVRKTCLTLKNFTQKLFIQPLKHKN